MTNKGWILICVIAIGFYCVFSWGIYVFNPLLPIELPMTLSYIEIALLLLLGINHLIEKE